MRTLTQQLDQLGHRSTPLRFAIEERLDGYLRDVQIYEQLHDSDHHAAKSYADTLAMMDNYMSTVPQILEREPKCGNENDDMLRLIECAWEERTIGDWDRDKDKETEDES